MSSLSVFNFNSNQVRVILIDGEPWFVANDVCQVLELDNTTEALKRLKVYEKDGIDLNDTIGRTQRMLVISESGLYRLILRSNKPQAEPFQDWVVQEVLPQIRKTGKFDLQIQKESTSNELHLLGDAIDIIYSKVEIRPELVAGIKLNALKRLLSPASASALEIARDPLINNTATSDNLLTATKIGEKLGLSAIKVNRLLEEKGLQKKNDKKTSKKDSSWIPTDKGSEFSDFTLATGNNNNDTYYQLRWYESVLKQI